ncbi:MAG: ABC transporter ATP-binding protein [Thermoplasmatales archaeon]|nr:ABC transporter ATP-binding protein [Candidatus Thermoplasmatota archaeon]MDA8055373.1 ABC transporter ATP-binding protein [Thermoplasmatales archaeon]
MDNRLLSIENLKISFDTSSGIARVVDGVNLELDRGEVVTLVGETGCGKSILLKSILRLLATPPSIIENRIVFEGVDLLSLEDSQFIKYRGSKISYIPQSPQESLVPVFTVREQFVDLLLFRGMKRVSRPTYYGMRSNKKVIGEITEKIIKLLRDVRISDENLVLDYYPFQLSGGMAQRVLIAMALSGNPSLILADEPTTALDVTIQKQITDMINDLRNKYKLSILYVTHNLGLAREISDRVYIMYAGKIVENGISTGIFNNPLHPYTKGLLSSVPKLSGEKFRGIEGTIPSYVGPPTGCRFNPRCPVAIKACSEKEPTMKEVEKNHFVSCYAYGGE